MLTFYFAPGSSSMAAHIALHETGADFASRPVSLANKETRTAEFLAINPAGKVPTLLIDGRALTEVAGILFYLAKRFPGARLLPTDDVEAQARVISWMSFVASGLHPVWARGPEIAQPIYELADQRLGANDWAVGGAYSIADIHLFRLYWRYANKFQPPRGTLPNLERHHDRMLKRPAVAKTLEIESSIQ